MRHHNGVGDSSPDNDVSVVAPRIVVQHDSGVHDPTEKPIFELSGGSEPAGNLDVTLSELNASGSINSESAEMSDSSRRRLKRSGVHFDEGDNTPLMRSRSPNATSLHSSGSFTPKQRALVPMNMDGLPSRRVTMHSIVSVSDGMAAQLDGKFTFAACSFVTQAFGCREDAVLDALNTGLQRAAVVRALHDVVEVELQEGDTLVGPCRTVKVLRPTGLLNTVCARDVLDRRVVTGVLGVFAFLGLLAAGATLYWADGSVLLSVCIVCCVVALATGANYRRARGRMLLRQFDWWYQVGVVAAFGGTMALVYVSTGSHWAPASLSMVVVALMVCFLFLSTDASVFKPRTRARLLSACCLFFAAVGAMVNEVVVSHAFPDRVSDAMLQVRDVVLFEASYSAMLTVLCGSLAFFSLRFVVMSMVYDRPFAIIKTACVPTEPTDDWEEGQMPMPQEDHGTPSLGIGAGNSGLIVLHNPLKVELPPDVVVNGPDSPRNGPPDHLELTASPNQHPDETPPEVPMVLPVMEMDMSENEKSSNSMNSTSLHQQQLSGSATVSAGAMSAASGARPLSDKTGVSSSHRTVSSEASQQSAFNPNRFLSIGLTIVCEAQFDRVEAVMSQVVETTLSGQFVRMALAEGDVNAGDELLGACAAPVPVSGVPLVPSEAWQRFAGHPIMVVLSLLLSVCGAVLLWAAMHVGSDGGATAVVVVGCVMLLAGLGVQLTRHRRGFLLDVRYSFDFYYLAGSSAAFAAVYGAALVAGGVHVGAVAPLFVLLYVVQLGMLVGSDASPFGVRGRALVLSVYIVYFGLSALLTLDFAAEKTWGADSATWLRRPVLLWLVEVTPQSVLAACGANSSLFTLRMLLMVVLSRAGTLLWYDAPYLDITSQHFESDGGVSLSMSRESGAAPHTSFMQRPLGANVGRSMRLRPHQRLSSRHLKASKSSGPSSVSNISNVSSLHVGGNLNLGTGPTGRQFLGSRAPSMLRFPKPRRSLVVFSRSGSSVGAQSGVSGSRRGSKISSSGMGDDNRSQDEREAEVPNPPFAVGP